MLRSGFARSLRHLLLLASALFLAAATPALADPPARVLRLSFAAGNVSFSPAGDPDRWVQAPLNRPLFIGDRVWSDRGARAELELGTAAIRAGELSDIAVLNLDDRLTQLEVAQGRVEVRVRSLASDESFEIDTPNLAFSILRPGSYRVEVADNGESTVIAIRDGRGEVYGDGNSYAVERNQWYRFYGTALENDYARIPAPDDLDRFALSREARHERSASARYVSRSVIGYDDLDAYGSWSVLPDYGNVWVPHGVSAEWAPYRDGHWAWIEPWGWTWIDDAPWGFAPFHYGRWAYADSRWCWVPGPVNVRPIYAPALVAFVGGSDVALKLNSTTVRGVAWFPLGPGEVYRPAYRVTRNYFTEVNVTNTRIDHARVTSLYEDANAARSARYRYRELATAVTAVAANAFVDGRSVARAALPRPVVAELVQRAPVSSAPAITPARTSIVGAGTAASARPAASVGQRHIVARSAPPAAAPAYAPRELDVNPGNVVDANPRHAPSRPRAEVRVVTPATPVLSGATAQHRGGPGANASAPAPGSFAPQPTAPPPPVSTAGPTPPVARKAPGIASAPAPTPAPVGPHRLRPAPRQQRTSARTAVTTREGRARLSRNRPSPHRRSLHRRPAWQRHMRRDRSGAPLQ